MVDLGPPPKVKAIEKDETHIKKTTANIPGSRVRNIGNSIKKNISCLLKPRLSANLSCSAGIEFHPCNNNLETSGKLKKIFAIIIP